MSKKQDWNEIVTQRAGTQGIAKMLAELAEFRRQWELEHPMPPLPPKKHLAEKRKGVLSKRPSHLPPPDWKDQS